MATENESETEEVVKKKTTITEKQINITAIQRKETSVTE